MLWTIVVSLIAFWLAGLIGEYAMGDFVHAAFPMAIIALLFQVEEDCRTFPSRRAKGGHSKKKRGPGAGKEFVKAGQHAAREPVAAGLLIANPQGKKVT